MKIEQILNLSMLLGTVRVSSSFTQQPPLFHHPKKSRRKCVCDGGNSQRVLRPSVRAKSELSARFTVTPPVPATDISRTATKCISGMHIPYQSTIQVLQKYHEQHGNLVIPRGYRVPCTKDFPPEWHNLYLSNTVYNMNWWAFHVASRPERVYELNQLEFVWEKLQPEYNLVLEALIIYKSIHGQVQVPASFVVPYEDAEKEGWPKATWGIPLGNCVHRIRSRGDFLRDDETAWARRRQLDNLGFVWDVSEQAFRKFLLAVKYYAKHEQEFKADGLFRPLKVKSTFVVPAGQMLEDSNKKNPWPEEFWGYPLGVKCSAVRQKGLYIKNDLERQKALVEVGLLPSGNSTLVWLEVVHAAAIYAKLHGKKLDVPVNFVVPSPPRSSSSENITSLYQDGDDWPWPNTLWGLKLGQRLKDVRLKGAYLKNAQTAVSRRAQLDALGFVWQPKRGRRKRSLGATV